MTPPPAEPDPQTDQGDGSAAARPPLTVLAKIFLALGLCILIATAVWSGFWYFSGAGGRKPGWVADIVSDRPAGGPIDTHPAGTANKADTAGFLAAIAEVQRSVAARAPRRPAAGHSVEASADDSDERLPLAFSFLRARKVDAATRLLEAVGNDRSLHPPRSLSDAAIAYRTLGDITTNSDKALDAYERAIELAPEDVQALLGDGWVALQQGLLGEAERRFRLAETFMTAGTELWDRFRMVAGLGSIREQRADIADAVALYRAAIAACGEQIQAEPEEAAWQRGLAAADEKMADLFGNHGSRRDALAVYRSALAIMSRLVQSAPGNDEWQHSLSALGVKLGDTLLALGDAPAALEAYDNALTVARHLAKAAPKEARWQTDLSICLERLGDARAAAGDAAGALDAYQAAGAVTKSPGSVDTAERQRDLAGLSVKTGDVLVARGDTRAGLQAYNEGYAILDNLVRASPLDTGPLRDLGFVYQKIGIARALKNDADGALKAFRDAVAILDHLAKAEPSNDAWQRDLYVAYRIVGDTLFAAREWSGAVNAYRSSLFRAETLVASDPDDDSRQVDVEDAYEKMANVLSAQADPAGAMNLLNDARAVSQRGSQSAADPKAWQRRLGLVLDKIGDAAFEKGDAALGMRSYHDALAINERLLQSDPDNSAWQQDLLWTNLRLAHHGDDAARRWALIAENLQRRSSHQALTGPQAELLQVATQALARSKQ